MKRKTYIARYAFEDGDWIVEVDGIPQVHTFGRTLARARENIRDALALWVQASDASALVIDEEFEGLPRSVVEAVAEANETRAKAAELSDRAHALTADAVQRLVGELGLTVRDAANLLHISHQRVHQLVEQ